MKSPWIKTLPGVAAAAIVAAVAFAPAANAACAWDGYNWNCSAPYVAYPSPPTMTYGAPGVYMSPGPVYPTPSIGTDMRYPGPKTN
jgi:hypothetical protein